MNEECLFFSLIGYAEMTLKKTLPHTCLLESRLSFCCSPCPCCRRLLAPNSGCGVVYTLSGPCVWELSCGMKLLSVDASEDASPF